MADVVIEEGVEIPDLGAYENLQIQPINSWDLTKTTFIIPLRCESADRIRNITTTLIYLLRNFDTQIIIKEHDYVMLLTFAHFSYAHRYLFICIM